ncbi:MAG: hypothetical protein QXI12_13505, partial [Candidatus Methanomethyliaceae archaeon]
AGIDAFVNLINTSPYYAGIRATRGQPVSVQLQAIAESPFDSGHYTDPNVGTVGSKLTEAEGVAERLIGSGNVSAPVNNTQSLLDIIKQDFENALKSGSNSPYMLGRFGEGTGNNSPSDNTGGGGLATPFTGGGGSSTAEDQSMPGLFTGLEQWIQGIAWKGLVYVLAGVVILFGLFYLIKGQGVQVSV